MKHITNFKIAITIGKLLKECGITDFEKPVTIQLQQSGNFLYASLPKSAQQTLF